MQLRYVRGCQAELPEVASGSLAVSISEHEPEQQRGQADQKNGAHQDRENESGGEYIHGVHPFAFRGRPRGRLDASAGDSAFGLAGRPRFSSTSGVADS
jgi:hypothetical protein